MSASSYFAKLQHGLMAKWHPTIGSKEIPSWAQSEISRIDVFRGAVVLRKLDKINFSTDLPWIEDLVRRSTPESLLYFSEYLERRAGLLERALDTAHQGAAMAPNNPWFQARISQLMVKMGNVEAAIAAARKAVDLAPDHPHFRSVLHDLVQSQRMTR
jgi:tetratricopeptide (TPR) repeat protein